MVFWALKNLIEWFRAKEKIDFNVLPFNIDSRSALNNSSWLSGFIEADGHFSVRSTLDGKYPKIECRFELSQRQNDHLGHNNKLFLENISMFLNTSLKNIREKTSYPQYRLRTINLNSNFLLINYLEKYPLFGSKFLYYKDWREIVDLFKPRFKYSEDNIKQIINLKSGMNDRRTIFIWDHLNKFYNLDY